VDGSVEWRERDHVVLDYADADGSGGCDDDVVAGVGEWGECEFGGGERVDEWG
jgi:hypothetical protein